MKCFMMAMAGVICLTQYGAEAERVNPDCMNPTKKGHIVCTIDQPVVTQKETVYSSVVFVRGDLVTVHADGCVQTGGKGLTWKRYVNPYGPNSDRLYHGLINIPNFTPNGELVRIGTVIGVPITISADGVAGAPLLLHLGYEDDAYGDNGYTKHDDGSGGQCRLSKTGLDGGPAHVTITIDRR